MVPTVKPLPQQLLPLSEKIAAWAEQKKLINRIYVFGGMFKGTPNPKDLDLAVEYILTEDGEIDGQFIFDCEPWSKELARTTGLTIDLDLAHPSCDETVWPALSQGCAIIYERSTPIDLPWLSPAT